MKKYGLYIAMGCGVSLAVPAAAQVSVQLNGGQIASVTASGYQVDASQLVPGSSTGTTDVQGPVTLADDLDLDSYFARNSATPLTWDVALASWTDTNGAHPDFFVFEIGGNDGIEVAPRLADGSYGQSIALDAGQWSDTGYGVTGGANQGQHAFGLALGRSQLLGNDGLPLSETAVLAGLRLTSGTIDGAVLVVVDPGSAINHPPQATLTINPTAISSDDAHQTVVTLDASQSVVSDPGQTLRFDWLVNGGRFVDATGPHDALVHVTFPGGVPYPVTVTVTDDGQPPLSDQASGTVGVEGMVGEVHGTLRVWYPIELWFRGPTATETDVSPNPFLDFRLIVTLFGPSGQELVVPGFFDGDGQGGGAGSVWKARFAVDERGDWSYRVAFRSGTNIAVDDTQSGTSGQLDGGMGRFVVGGREPAAPGFLRCGRLEHVGEHYLRFRDGGYFIKGGTDSPENFFGYAGFDDVTDAGGILTSFLHQYASHRSDWREGDPNFVGQPSGVDAKGIIGALNYLSTMHVNSIYFLPMNLGGDGQDTCPFVGYANNESNKTHFDISRLFQWDTVFRHAQEDGILIHFVLAETETENEQWLGTEGLSRERKLFFRELVARFGYLLAVKWNLSEENDFSVETLREQAAYIRSQDPYDHPIAVHTHPNDFRDYEQLVGDAVLDATSIQYAIEQANHHVEHWRSESAAAGRPWVIDMDENNPAGEGLSPTNADELRRSVLYPVYLSGGNIEWYAGYYDLPPGGDVNLEDFRTREPMWEHMWYARRFMQESVPYWRMTPNDALLATAVGVGQVFVLPGQVYVAYLPQGGSATLDLSGAAGDFIMEWFDPRRGERVEPVQTITGGKPVDLGTAPRDPDQDWVIWLRAIDWVGPGAPFGTNWISDPICGWRRPCGSDCGLGNDGGDPTNGDPMDRPDAEHRPSARGLVAGCGCGAPGRGAASLTGWGLLILVAGWKWGRRRFRRGDGGRR